MKKVSITLIVLLTSITVFGQTNKIELTGNIGIGTLNPDSKLHLKDGSMSISHSSSAPTINFVDDEDGDRFSLSHHRSENKFYIYDTDYNKIFAIDQDGKVGVGASSPLDRFHLKDGSMRISHSSDAPTIRLVDDEDGDEFSLVHDRADNRFYIRDSDDNKVFTIDQDGNIGVGVISPNNKLHLKDGSMRISHSSNAPTINFVDDEDGDSFSLAHHRSENRFYIYDTDYNKIFAIDQDGNVGIGKSNPKNKLSVNGTIWAKEVKVSLEDAADWVFEDDYELKPLEEVETFVKSNKHLPSVPSAEEFRENDLNVAEMDNLLLQKIEELTLYLIEQNKKTLEQQKLIEGLQKEVSELKSK